MSKKITFSQLVDELSEQTNSTQNLSHDFITKLTDLVINNAVESGKASITNLGNFSVVNVSARNGVNPQTGEAIVIPAHQRLSFSPYKALGNSVNAPFASLEATIIEEPKVKPTVSKKMKKVGSSVPLFIAIIAALIIVTVGIWFFVFRDNNQTEVAQEIASIIEQSVENSNQVLTPEPTPDVQEEEKVVQPPLTEEDFESEIPVETGLVEYVTVGTSSHIVKKGEWFYDIARNTYKITTFWPLIFEANFTVTQDPDILNPGENLEIPAIENPQNPTSNDRARLMSAAKAVSEAYSNAGKVEKAEAYSKMAERFSR